MGKFGVIFQVGLIGLMWIMMIIGELTVQLLTTSHYGVAYWIGMMCVVTGLLIPIWREQWCEK